MPTVIVSSACADKLDAITTRKSAAVAARICRSGPVAVGPGPGRRADLDAGNVPHLDQLHEDFKPDRATFPDVAVELTPLTAYDELAMVCQPKAELVLDGGVA